MTLINFYSKIIRHRWIKWGNILAIKATVKKPLFGNRRSHSLRATRHAQLPNLQKVTLEDGTKVKMSARELRTLKKNARTNVEEISAE